MPQHTSVTPELLQDVVEAYDVIKSTLIKAEKLNDAELGKKINELKLTKSKLEKQAAYYGLDIANPVYVSDLGSLSMIPILPMAVIANIGLANAIAIMQTVKDRKPMTVGIGLQLIMGGLLIGLLTPVVLKGLK